MKICEIKELPTTSDKVPEFYANQGLPDNFVPGAYDFSRMHESLFRSFQILDKVKDYIRRGVPADVLLELIEEMEGLK